MTSRLPCLLLLALLALAPAARAHSGHAAPEEPALRVQVPDEELFDQDGRKVRLYSDLVRGHVVAVNFVFTTCTTICSPMTAVFGKLQDAVGGRLGKDVRLLSISLDPRTDTPERLKAYADKFQRREGWSFLTGPADRVQRVLRALGGEVADKERHTPVVLLGNDATGRWTRAYGLSAPTRLAEQLEALRAPAPGAKVADVPITAGPEADRAAARYFTDTELVDQHGKPHRFYSDLIRGKKVLINFAFASCKTACSPLTANLARVQRLLGERVGRDVQMVTLTVDPAHDSPEQLRAFTKKFKVRPGWAFLSGERKNVEAVLRKLGGYTDTPDKHLTTVLVGDAVTGNWVKVPGLAPAETIANAVEHINDPMAMR